MPRGTSSAWVTAYCFRADISSPGFAAGSKATGKNARKKTKTRFDQGSGCQSFVDFGQKSGAQILSGAHGPLLRGRQR